MKKRYSSKKYKRINRTRSKRAARKLYQQNKKWKKDKNKKKKQHHWTFGDKDLKPPIIAPEDFRLTQNTDECLEFFSLVRKQNSASFIPPSFKYVLLDLSRIKEIDYASMTILIAISHYFSSKSIGFRGNFPKNNNCREFIEQSGFLDFMKDEKGKPFEKAEKASYMRFQNEEGIFTEEESRNISNLLRKTSMHLTTQNKSLPQIKTMLIEIFGNSVEWSRMNNKMRLLGIYREEGKVTFTAIDLGEGILATIRRKWKEKLKDWFAKRTPVEILNQAFKKKYGSSTGEVNRAKGLICVKDTSDTKKIVNLSVITNNVLLDFDNYSNSRKLTTPFRGTLYCWEMTTECINNMTIPK